MTDHPNLKEDLIHAQMHRILVLEMILEDLEKYAKFQNIGTVVISRTDWDLCMNRWHRKQRPTD